MDAVLQGDLDAMGFWNDMPEDERDRLYRCAVVLGHVFETDVNREFEALVNHGNEYFIGFDMMMLRDKG